MKLKSYLYFDRDKLTLEFTDKPISFKGIEIGRIKDAGHFNKETGQIDITIEIYKNNVEDVIKLLGIKTEECPLCCGSGKYNIYAKCRNCEGKGYIIK